MHHCSLRLVLAYGKCREWLPSLDSSCICVRWSGGGSFRKARIWGCAESLVTNPYCAIRTRCEGNVRVPTLADGAEPRAIQASRVKDEERVNGCNAQTDCTSARFRRSKGHFVVSL